MSFPLDSGLSQTDQVRILFGGEQLCCFAVESPCRICGTAGPENTTTVVDGDDDRHDGAKHRKGEKDPSDGFQLREDGLCELLCHFISLS